MTLASPQGKPFSCIQGDFPVESFWTVTENSALFAPRTIMYETWGIVQHCFHASERYLSVIMSDTKLCMFLEKASWNCYCVARCRTPMWHMFKLDAHVGRLGKKSYARHPHCAEVVWLATKGRCGEKTPTSSKQAPPKWHPTNTSRSICWWKLLRQTCSQKRDDHLQTPWVRGRRERRAGGDVTRRDIDHAVGLRKGEEEQGERDRPGSKLVTWGH